MYCKISNKKRYNKLGLLFESNGKGYYLFMNSGQNITNCAIFRSKAIILTTDFSYKQTRHQKKGAITKDFFFSNDGRKITFEKKIQDDIVQNIP